MLKLVSDDQGVAMVLPTVDGGSERVYLLGYADHRAVLVVDHPAEKVEPLLLREIPPTFGSRRMPGRVLFYAMQSKGFDLILKAKRHIASFTRKKAR